ncbi:response regulator [Candidatus Leptofilum sp.]|uniref:response regulator n=1 Tax=Candidatus Leptofilum sp. TaxID=3241576 RepID=UPI003B590825
MSEVEKKPVSLIIEDDPDLIHIFARALELSGYETKTVEDGTEAIALLAKIVPDIVVLDLHLPGVSGREILRAIRADGRLTHTRVILATADYRTVEDLREDADLVLLKPISFKQLRDLSSRFLQTNKRTTAI